MPEDTLHAFGKHGEPGHGSLLADGGNSGPFSEKSGKAGVELDALATKLQEEGRGYARCFKEGSCSMSSLQVLMLLARAS